MSKPIYHEKSDHLCDYGCGNPAHYELKSGKWICAKSANSCPVNKQRKKEAFIAKFGVDNPGKSKAVRDKMKATCLEKYGTASTGAVKEFRDKMKATMVEKYGVDNPGKSTEIKKKVEETRLAKYGHRHHFSSPEIKKQIKETNNKKYNGNSPTHSPEVRKKQSETNIKRYGVSNPMQNDVIRNKSKKIQLDKNYENLTQRNAGLVKPGFDRSEYKGADYRYEWQCTECSTSFFDFARNGHIPSCPKCNPVLIGRSAGEKELAEFVESLGLNVVVNNRKLLIDHEVDIWVPEKQVAIEYHGLYWHSNKFKSKKYHAEKLAECDTHGIRLIQIFEDEWLNKRKVVENRIFHILNMSGYIAGARQCVIKVIDTKSAAEFLEDNHIQGSVGAKVKLGAFYQDELVAVMTFGSLRKSMGSVAKEGSFELLRFASAGSVPGIASKLFKFFVRNYKPNEVISYCDLRWGTGRVYEQMGFELSHVTAPNYFYVAGQQRKSRFSFRKDILINDGFNPEMTEKEIMEERGFLRIYDAGNKVFKWKNTTVVKSLTL